MRTKTITYKENLVFIYEASKETYRIVCMLQKHGENDYSLSCMELEFPEDPKKAEKYLVHCLINSEEHREEGWSVRGSKEDILEEMIEVFDY